MNNIATPRQDAEAFLVKWNIDHNYPDTAIIDDLAALIERHRKEAEKALGEWVAAVYLQSNRSVSEFTAMAEVVSNRQ